MKKIALLLVAAIALTACGGEGTGEQSPTPSDTASASQTPAEDITVLESLDEITVSENFGETPQVDAPHPFKVTETLSEVVVEGDGPEVPDASASVQVHYLGINARSGDTFDSSFERGEPVVFQLGQVVPGFAKGLEGKKQGSRVLIAITSVDGYDQMGGNPQAGIEIGDTLIFVVDLLRVQQNPTGDMADTPNQLPKVSEQDGTPVIDIAGAPEPAATETFTLIEGTGRALGQADVLSSNATCTTWDGSVYYNDFGEPATMNTAEDSLKPLFEALVGTKEGSRVLVTIPGEQAYPKGNPYPPMEPNTSVACVVDVKFTQEIPVA